MDAVMVDLLEECLNCDESHWLGTYEEWDMWPTADECPCCGEPMVLVVRQ